MRKGVSVCVVALAAAAVASAASPQRRSDLYTLTIAMHVRGEPVFTVALASLSKPHATAQIVVDRTYDITGDVNRVTWSPDGHGFAYTGGVTVRGNYRPGLFLRRTAGGSRRLTRGYDADPAWSPDGKTIAFVRATGTGKRRTWRLFLFSLASGRAHALPDPLPRNASHHYDRAPSWSPDGRTLLFDRWNCAKYCVPDVWALSIAGEKLRKLVRDGAQTTWSPDGRSFAFMGGHSSRNGIWVATADGKHLHRVIANITAGGPSWSPDGRWIGYIAAPASKWTADPKTFEAYVVRPSGRDRERVTNDKYDENAFAWMPRPITA